MSASIGWQVFLSGGRVGGASSLLGAGVLCSVRLTMDLLPSFNAGGLIASVIWGGLGMGFFVYGKKQRSAPALLGGIALIGISYFMLNSAVWMSVAGAGIVAGVYYWSRRGEE